MVTDKNLRNQTLLLEGLLFRRHNEILFTFIYGIIPRKPRNTTRYKFWWIWSICPRIKQFDPFVHLSQKQNKIKQNTKHKHKTHTHTKQDRLVNKTSTHISGFLKNQKPSYQPDKQKNRVPFPALLSSKKKKTPQKHHLWGILLSHWAFIMRLVLEGAEETCYLIHRCLC